MSEWYLLLYDFDTLHPEIQKQTYQKFYAFVYKDIYYLLKDHPLTEDLILEAFFKITSNIDRHQINNPTSWIRQVTRNQTRDYLRKNKKERYITEFNDVITIDDHFDQYAAYFQVEQEIENKTRDELLHQSIVELKSDYRMIIVQHYIEEMSYKEIAAALDISEQAVGQRLLRARKKLLQIFQRKWVKFSE